MKLTSTQFFIVPWKIDLILGLFRGMEIKLINREIRQLNKHMINGYTPPLIVSRSVFGSVCRLD